MNRKHRVALAAGAAILAWSPLAANHSWGGYHWASGGTLNVTVVRSVTPNWTTYVNGAIADWENSNKLTLGVADGDTSSISRKRCQPIAGKVRVCNALYGQRGWVGLATIWLSNNHISQGVTQLNDTYFNMSFYNTPAWRKFVACQEIGHDWGLDHQDENFNNANLGSCMDYTRAPQGGVYSGFNYGPSNEHPNAHDYDMLAQIYNHNDGFTTSSGMTAKGAVSATEEAGLGPEDWGRPVRRDSLGRPNVFIKALGPGQAKVTHVFWAFDARVR